ncbi:TonB-dependent receptor [Comamonas endophytica]|uniref:TonB-dependent siderophore receptor n=1 Tax=Comamonas endophytica TaxID=2949090 RepID=A0ABY6GFI5_9BURK|nr:MULTISPECIES: TonB-dependent siderophore receptor [unclassified Acidovorax]MCD2512186.1 TonB-dependent siderophore receptor [Acidovorax sp. D4N7]UYG53224.1 TonB-dependent siderophore receptor [Acidovorax sp. 5MLIR]
MAAAESGTAAPSTSTSDKTLLPLGAMLLAASVGSWAQSPAAPEATMGTVTVREAAEVQGKDTLLIKQTTVGKGKQDIKDIPQSVTVFTERLLADRNQDDFREVLRTTAGVTFQAGETGEEDVRLRGFSLGQAGDIYVDGMKDAPLYERDTFNNDRIEVLKGSASMLFGKGSTGGVVNQVNKAPLLIDQHEASYTLGNGKYHRAQGDFNFKTGENAALRVNAMIHDSDNYGAKQDKRGIAPTFSWGIGTRDEFSVGLYYLDIKGRPNYNSPWIISNGRIVPTLPAKNYYGLSSDHLDTSSKYLTLGHIHRFDDGGELQTRLRHGKYERDLLASVIGFSGTRPTSLDQITDATRLTRTSKGRIGESTMTQLQSDYTNEFNWGGNKHQIIAGLDYYHDDANRNSNYANAAGNSGANPALLTSVGTPDNGAWAPDNRAPVAFNTFKAQNIGLYLQDTMSLTSTVKLVGGLRYDQFKASYRNATGALSDSTSEGLWSPRVGVIFQPDELSSYYVSFGTSYNTSGDTYQFGGINAASATSGGTASLANTAPEKSRNLEIGGKWELFERRALLGVAAFYSEKFNERNTDPDDVTNYVLSGKRHAAGMEFNLAGHITPQWDIFFNHTWIPEAKIDRSSVAFTIGGAQIQGDRPALSPKHSGSIWSTYAVTPKLRLGAGLTYRDKQSPEGSRALMSSGFATIDAMAEYTFDQKTSLKLNVTNVSDKLYADSLYRGFYTAGAARAVQLTVKTRF